MDADIAAAMGIIDEVVPKGDLLGQARAVAADYAESPAETFASIKAQMRAAFYGEDSQWKADIWSRGQQIVEQALAGVHG